jgi:23S rRNA (pseudouridine1915-N3)-methyltransferase
MITILAVSDGYDHFREPIEEYLKRLGSDARVERVRPERKRTDPAGILAAETGRILEYLAKNPRLVPILLDERGKTETTVTLAARLARWRGESVKPCFIVGGAYGVDRAKFPDAPMLRLSDLVLPHSLALLVLLEQIYRCREIERGSGYHHA